MNNYPASVEELELDSVQLDPAVVEVVKQFAAAKPYRGTVEQRKLKFIALGRGLAAAFDVPPPFIIFSLSEFESSGASFYTPATSTITLCGRLSCITFLHEFGHHVFGESERRACQFSLALFKRCFPRSFSRLTFDGHMARKSR